MVVLVVAVVVLPPLGGGEGGFVAVGIVAVAVGFSPATHGDGFGEFPPQFVIADGDSKVALKAGDMGLSKISDAVDGGIKYPVTGTPRFRQVAPVKTRT